MVASLNMAESDCLYKRKGRNGWEFWAITNRRATPRVGRPCTGKLCRKRAFRTVFQYMNFPTSGEYRSVAMARSPKQKWLKLTWRNARDEDEELATELEGIRP
jgi:hypothetical protein